jgi:hypothetical protein
VTACCNDGPLPNATIWIEGTHKETKTDLLGRFKFDSLPPGTYRLSFNHPAFDAAGVGAPSLEGGSFRRRGFGRAARDPVARQPLCAAVPDCADPRPGIQSSAA